MNHYRLNFERYSAHLVGIEFEFVAHSDTPTLYLPNWIAGSYMIRDFAKYIANVCYVVDSQTKRASKLSKNTWQIFAKQGDTVRVVYEVYCYDLSVRTAYVDSTRIFGNFSSLLLMIKGDEYATCTIDLQIPDRFFGSNTKLAVGLPFVQKQVADNVIYHLDKLPNNQPLTGFDSMDFPFEISEQQQIDFSIKTAGKTIAHRFFLSGATCQNSERLKTDLGDICQAYADWLGWVPFEHYTFMTYATKKEYGGLEHINSTALVIPRQDLPSVNEDSVPNANYQRFLGLCSHEYFHAWWVKSVRPDVMMTSLLDTEAYTPLLWVFEGFTSYVDDMMLYRSGVINQSSYLKLFADQLTRYLNTEGRHHQTVAESSFDAWIKLYHPNENSPNSTVSYYNKGAIVAFGLDVLLMKHGKRLFDVIAHFVTLAKAEPTARFGMSVNNFDTVISQFLPSDVWQQFNERYINGVDELPIAQWLHDVGALATIKQQDESFGATVQENALGLHIKRLHPNSPLVEAGISVNDTVVAINHLKADKALFDHIQHDDEVLFHVFRQDRLMQMTVKKGQSFALNQVTITADEESLWLK